MCPKEAAQFSSPTLNQRCQLHTRLCPPRRLQGFSGASSSAAEAAPEMEPGCGCLVVPSGTGTWTEQGGACSCSPQGQGRRRLTSCRRTQREPRRTRSWLPAPHLLLLPGHRPFLPGPSGALPGTPLPWEAWQCHQSVRTPGQGAGHHLWMSPKPNTKGRKCPQLSPGGS